MAFIQVSIKLDGSVPLLLNSSRLADPTYSYTKAIKQYTSKRKKTESDLEKISEYEFKGSLTINDKGQIIIPDLQIEGMIVDGAKKLRLGKEASAGIRSLGHAVLQFPNACGVDELYEQQEHHFRASCVIQGKRVMKTRPIFREWSLELDLEFDESLLNLNQIRDILQEAGTRCGIGTWRPRFGRFLVARCEALRMAA